MRKIRDQAYNCFCNCSYLIQFCSSGEMANNEQSMPVRGRGNRGKQSAITSLGKKLIIRYKVKYLPVLLTRRQLTSAPYEAALESE